MPIEKKQDLLLKSLLIYYKNSNNLKKLLNVLLKKSKISLRVVDYLCTNYSKHHDVMYYIGNRKTPFNLFLDYRSQLKAYSKLQFDPFKRHDRITINVPKNLVDCGTLETTVAQLNFFKWAIESKILDYLEQPKNLKIIDTHMNNTLKKNKSKSDTNVFTTSAKKHDLKVTVTFK